MTELEKLKAAAKEAAAAGEWFTTDDLFMSGEFEAAEGVYIAAADPSTVLALIAQIEAVTTLHKPRETEGGLTVCDHCCSQYPCHTVKAIGDAA